MSPTMPEQTAQPIQGSKDACVVSMEVDGRQRFIFQTDKLQEMLGASRIIAKTTEKAQELFKEEDGLFLFSPVSGEIRAWSRIEQKKKLLDVAWTLAEWMDTQGLNHSACYLETYSEHFCTMVSDNARSASHTINAEGDLQDPGPDCPDLAWVHWALGELIRIQKDSKTSGDARPSCSLFSSCRMHATEPANLWLGPPPEGQDNDDADVRRRLLGWSAAYKREVWQVDKMKIYENLIQAVHESGYTVFSTFEKYKQSVAGKISQRFSLFVSSRNDSYIGYACGDGDGMGDLLANLHWNDGSRWGNSSLVPWKVNREFVNRFDSLVKKAYRKSIIHELNYQVNVLQKPENEATKRIYTMVLPQLLGGDDMWIVGSRATVASICPAFIKEYAELAMVDPEFEVLRSALAVAEARRAADVPEAATAGTRQPTPLAFTVSMGIGFAKATYPVAETIEYAEALMKKAKRIRKGEPMENRNGLTTPDTLAAVPVGCIDWHWIESTLMEDLDELRRKGLSCVDVDNSIHHLTSRPWSGGEFEKMTEAARLFQKIPRSKREMLEDIVRRGSILGQYAWKQWIAGLDSEQRTILAETVSKLPSGFQPQTEGMPWVLLHGAEIESKDKMTPFIDLLALQHVLGLEGSTSTQERYDEP